jgi:hypothetical protein
VSKLDVAAADVGKAHLGRRLLDATPDGRAAAGRIVEAREMTDRSPAIIEENSFREIASAFQRMIGNAAFSSTSNSRARSTRRRYSSREARTDPGEGANGHLSQPASRISAIVRRQREQGT